ncbi:hypothetical protein [Hyphomicrobium sp.]|uniref:hypothetical protein n=1 Tax=Hyphomicrobium sp. TaxID=82 RepID=UPI001DC236BB|nr:hypothetical protein [Hyphomicrobium sp.]MBY0561510.1 hypothetical protein [Hyphomicrobium sp.]
MATRPAHGWQITNHAVERYRERVLGCPERTRSAGQLRIAIEGQLAFFASHYIKGNVQTIPCGPRWRISKTFRHVCENPTHIFIAVDGIVLTTYGFGMVISENLERGLMRKAREIRDQKLQRGRRVFEQILKTRA